MTNLNVGAFKCLLKAGHFNIYPFENEFGNDQIHAHHYFANGNSVDIFFNPFNKCKYLASITVLVYHDGKPERISIFSYEDIKPLKKRITDLFAEEERYFVSNPFMREVFSSLNI